MIIAGGVIILTKKYWPYFLGAFVLVIVINSFLFSALWLLPYLVAITILFPIVESFILGSKNAKKMLYSFGGLIAILIISYLMASNEVLGSYEKYEITSSTAKQVGMGLTTFYILGIGAIGAVLYAELSKSFAK
tara:strand:- start:110 stop:511 length:402 start_codon:yes stop_codon:yes gene_type:complete